MRVAVVSNRNRPGFVDENLADHLRWMARAADGGARLALFPELSLCGYSTAPFMRDMGMGLRDPACREICDAAKDHDLFLAFGMALKQGRRRYISQVLAGPDGIVGHYEKVHLAGGARGEGMVFTAGEAFRVFDVDGVGIGINICFDGRHPGSSLATAHLGAEVILHPHGNFVGNLGRDPREWTAKKRAYLGARSVDTCSYTLICNSVGDVRDRDGKRNRYGGGALVLGLDGEFVARSASKTRRPHMVLADLDIDDLRRRRSQGAFADRRAAVYAKALAGGTP